MKRLDLAVLACLLSASAVGAARAADPAPPDPVAAEKAKAEADTAYWNAVKAKSDAQSAQATAVSNAFPTSSTSGAVKLGDNAATAEANVMSAVLMDQAAACIVRDVKASDGFKTASTIVVFADKDAPDLSAWLGFNVKTGLIDRDLRAAIDKYDGIAKVKAAFALPLAAGAAVTVATKLMGLFAADYEAGGIKIDPDNYLLAAAVAGRLAPHARIASQMFDRTGAERLLARFDKLNDDYAEAVSDLAFAKAGSKPGHAHSDEYKAAADALQGAIDAYLKYLSDLGLPAPKLVKTDAPAAAQAPADVKALLDQFALAAPSPPPAPAAPAAPKAPAQQPGAAAPAQPSAPADRGALGDILHQMEIADAIEGGYALFLKAHFTGGSYYTKKNIFTALNAAMPFWVSSGAVASYSLVDGDTDQTLAAGVKARLRKYVRVSDVTDSVGFGASTAAACPAR